MCNFFTVRANPAEIAAHFDVPVPEISVPEEVSPRGKGLVIRQGKGGRVAQALGWGFPLPQTHKRTGKPIAPKPVNLVANLTSPMWQHIVGDTRYRCLIPLTAFGEPDGEPGAMTRTLFSVADALIAAWAGFCRNTPEWGPVFAGMTTDSNAAVAPLNPRMPVLLGPEDYDRWLVGDIADVIAFQFRGVAAERLVTLRTNERWGQRAAQKPAAPAFL